MTRERAFNIAYQVGKFIAGREPGNLFKPYEICIYISDLAKDILLADDLDNKKYIINYYKTLKEELRCTNDSQVKKEVKRLLGLLDECVNV